MAYLCRHMIRIGKIAATHGLNGALILTHIIGDAKWLKKEHVLHVEMQKCSYIPYFIEECKAAGDREYHIRLEDMNTIEAAKRLVGKPVYVDEGILAAFANRSPLLWIGFQVVDKQQGKVGTISDVLIAGAQWIGKIDYMGAEALVPLVPETIIKLDLKAKTIYLDIPNGLLELYL